MASVLELVEQLNGDLSPERPRQSLIIAALHQAHVQRGVGPTPHSVSSGTHTQAHPVAAGMAVERRGDPAVVEFESAVKVGQPEHDWGDLETALHPLHILQGQLQVAVDLSLLVGVDLPPDQPRQAPEVTVETVGLLLGAGEEVGVQLAQVSDPHTATLRVVALDGQGRDPVSSDDVVDWDHRLVADPAVFPEAGGTLAAVDAPAGTLRLAGVPGDHVT